MICKFSCIACLEFGINFKASLMIFLIVKYFMSLNRLSTGSTEKNENKAKIKYFIVVCQKNVRSLSQMRIKGIVNTTTAGEFQFQSQPLSMTETVRAGLRVNHCDFMVRAVHRHRTGVCLIPAGGPYS